MKQKENFVLYDLYRVIKTLEKIPNDIDLTKDQIIGLEKARVIVDDLITELEYKNNY